MHTVHTLMQRPYVDAVAQLCTRFICPCTQFEALREGTTHVYTFWQGLTPDAKAGVARLFTNCATAKVCYNWLMMM